MFMLVVGPMPQMTPQGFHGTLRLLWMFEIGVLGWAETPLVVKRKDAERKASWTPPMSNVDLILDVYWMLKLKLVL